MNSGYRPDVQRVSLQIGKNLATPRPTGGRNRQQYFARPRVADHLIDMPGLVYLEPGDDPIGQVGVVVDESNRAHRTPHSQRRRQLIARRARAVDGYTRQAVITSERDGQHARVPVTQYVLSQHQTQPAKQHQADPPVVEHQRTRHQRWRIAIPIDRQRQQQRRKRHRLGNGDQRIVAEIAHHRSVHSNADEQRDGQYWR